MVVILGLLSLPDNATLGEAAKRGPAFTRWKWTRFYIIGFVCRCSFGPYFKP